MDACIHVPCLSSVGNIIATNYVATEKGTNSMKVVFRSKDFASITAAGLGFNNRRPMADSWHYQGRVQHRDWQGTFECYWEQTTSPLQRSPSELLWTVYGDSRLFGLAAALKSLGYKVDVLQDEDK